MSMLKLWVVHDVLGLDKHLLLSFLDCFGCLNGGELRVCVLNDRTDLIMVGLVVLGEL